LEPQHIVVVEVGIFENFLGTQHIVVVEVGIFENFLGRGSLEKYSLRLPPATTNGWSYPSILPPGVGIENQSISAGAGGLGACHTTQKRGVIYRLKF
jgi:hypothetical protein